MLKDKKILLCVTGSIAIYKALELTRLYIKEGADVKVLMSESAKRFIAPLSFEAISGNKVLCEAGESWADESNHIHATKSVDMVVIAPATANTINKIACGIADTLLTQSILANTKPLLIAPAANTIMYTHETTQNSLNILRKRGVCIVNPISKLLACLDEGEGALAEVKTIFYATCKMFLEDKFWSKKNVVITGGGTKEAIDGVRYISNYSSGKMAEALGLAFYLLGANVTLISSAKAFYENLPIQRINFQSTQELQNALKHNLPKIGYLFMAAAVSDYRAKDFFDKKLKKSDLGKKWDLELIENEDILSQIKKNGLKIIGFKAEIDETTALKNAKSMLTKKSLDAVCLNVLGKDVQFGSEKTKMTFITASQKKELELDKKLNVAFGIANFSKAL